MRGKRQQGDIPRLLDGASRGRFGAWYAVRQLNDAAQSCRARRQIVAADAHPDTGLRRSFPYRTCKPSCGGKTCRVRRDRRQDVRPDVFPRPDRLRGRLNPLALAWVLPSPLREPYSLLFRLAMLYPRYSLCSQCPQLDIRCTQLRRGRAGEKCLVVRPMPGRLRPARP